MHFHLVDRILDVQPGKAIRAVKNLTMAEVYLADHFPTFPVMPGVLMLQALVETGSWLLRITDDFRYSIIALREVKNVKYGTFMEPGRQMLIAAEIAGQEGDLATLKGKGEVEGVATVSARFTLIRHNLCDKNPSLQATDARIADYMRTLYRVLGRNVRQIGADAPFS